MQCYGIIGKIVNFGRVKIYFMDVLTKKDFKYAALFDPDTGEYVSDGLKSGLIMGKETKKRFDSNSDDCAVTVCCITYKHEDLISKTLDGFLMQKTNFKFKVFVGEDHGPDGTADVIREYAKKYPDIIVPFIRENNMGAQTNLIDLCNHANSPYIAFCEGDDFWIDEYKLQKQFDYMQKHTEVRMCYTHTEILAPEDWHLNSYYKHDKDGKMIIPRCTPGFKYKKYYLAEDFVEVFPNHTSSAFYRWNYDLNIPDWYFKGLIGDTPITIMQMGEGRAAYLPDVTSVYRRSDVGVFMNKSDMDHFANTRLDYVRLLKGLREYFSDNFGNYIDGVYRLRITKEIANYLSAAENYGNKEMILRLLEEYPSEYFESTHTFVGAFNIFSSLKKRFKHDDLYHLYSTRTAFLFALPGLAVYSILSGAVVKAKKAVKYIVRTLKNHRGYWKYSKVPKEKNLWVFSGFRHNNYMDNTMYFYEYIVKNRPEINAVWLTTNPKIYCELKAKGMPVLKMDSPEGINTVARAEIAVTDHFVMSDFPPMFGFNDKTKVVQLWHGVGFKSMGDKDGVRNTKERGVVRSGDILIKDGDNFIVRGFKKIKYYFLAPFRECFEKYFLFVCPGQERLDMIADVWNIPHENCFMAGHPRDIPVYESKISKDPVKIMYAPTYRFDFRRESEMVREFLQKAPEIQALMEDIGGEFYLRMHPHTWRNYKAKILEKLFSFDRIFLDDSKDVYTEIGTLSVMISDYSSIALDFAMLDRPVIFHGSDYDWFVENEAGFNLDFPNVIPGPLTKSWDETLKKVKEYIENPQKDSELRKEKIKYFFDAEVNGIDNSERIVNEIEKRINLN